MRIAMIAPAWIKLPPTGYGGIEALIDAQLPEFVRQGHEVHVFTVGDSIVPEGVHMHWLYETGHYEHIHRLHNEISGIPAAHVLWAISAILEDGGFDIIHDHTGAIDDLLAFTHVPAELPPVLFTFHGPITLEHDRFGVGAILQAFMGSRTLFYNGISESQLAAAPVQLRNLFEGKVVGVVPNAIRFDDYPVVEHKDDYFTMVARITADKGQDRAVRICRQFGLKLILAGPVADVRFFRDEVEPFIDGRNIRYIPEVAGDEKLELLAKAAGFLSPHRWPEPFGVAPIEACACGTGVVAMNLGALGETIVHGENGYLAEANSVHSFQYWMGEINHIDPTICRESVERRFSPAVNVASYVGLYEEILERCAGMPDKMPHGFALHH